MHAKHAALVDAVLSGLAVTREIADLIIAGDAECVEPAVALFAAPVVAGELETLISADLDALAEAA